MRNLILLLSCLLLPMAADGQLYTFAGQIAGDNQGKPLFRFPAKVATDKQGNVYVADSDANRIKKFDSLGVFVTQWGVPGTGHGQFNTPVGIAVDSSGNVYVADRENQRIQKFGPDGSFLLTWGSGGGGQGEFVLPFGVACDPAGYVYVTDLVNQNVQKFDLMGNFILRWNIPPPLGGVALATGIAVKSSNEIVVADVIQNRLFVFSGSGVLQFQLIDPGNGSGGFVQLADVATDLSGNLYFLERQGDRVIKLSPEYVFISQWGAFGSDNGELDGPNGVAADRFGNVWVADSENTRVQKFTNTGTFRLSFGVGDYTLPGQLRSPTDVNIAPDGTILVADRDNGRVQRFAPNGTFQAQIGSPGSNNGQFEKPASVETDGNGVVYVLDDAAAEVQKFLPGGSFERIWVPIAGGNIRDLWVDSNGNNHITFLSTGTKRAGVVSFNNSGSPLPSLGITGYSGGPDSFLSPAGIARDSGGNFYVTDLQKHTVQKFSPSGDFLLEWGSPGIGQGQFLSPAGIAVDGLGSVLVVDRDNNRIQKFTASGQFVGEFGGTGAGPGQFYQPANITFDAKGRLFVADAGNDRIQYFDPCRISVVQSDSICKGDTLLFNNQKLSATGEYRAAFLTNSGCDSVVSLKLTVLEPIQTTLDTNLCEGKTLGFNGMVLDTAGLFRDTLTAQRTGCDSILLLTIQLRDTFNLAASKSVCMGASYLFGNQNLTAPGTYVHAFQSFYGCDSTVTLTFSLVDTLKTVLMDTICKGDSVSLGGQRLGASGHYEYKTTALSGCDSTVELHLTVLDTFRIVRYDTICKGDTLFYQSLKLFQAGRYEYVFPANAQRCDSTIEFRLTVLDTFRVVLRDTICRGDSIRFAGKTYLNPGVYIDTFPGNHLRCDSLIELRLTVLDTFRTIKMDTICLGDTLAFEGMKLHASGRYEHLYPPTGLRCDSTVELRLTVLDTFYTVRYDTICRGDTLRIGALSADTAGRYFYRFPPTALRCDSLIEVHLSVLDTFYSVVYDTICRGDTLFINGDTLTTSGVHQVVYPPTATRCDSTIELHLAVLPRMDSIVFDTICGGDSLFFGGDTLLASGKYAFSYPPTALRCDSTLTLHLTVLDSFYQETRYVICAGDSVVVNGETFRKSGVQKKVFNAANGCDSTYLYRVTVLDTFYTVLDTAICRGDRLRIGNAFYSSSGTYQYLFPATDTRCDSMLEVRLTVRDTFYTVARDSICQGDTLVLGNQKLFQPGVYTHTFPPTATRCDSTVVLTLSYRSQIRDTIEATTCSNEPYIIGDSILTGAGAYTIFLKTAAGCDSIVELNLRVLPIRRNFRSETICEGDSVFYGRRFYKTAGMYFDTITASNGCDSILALELKVIATQTSRVTRTICEGETYFFLNQPLRKAGIYRDTFTAQQTGCYLVFELDLRVTPAYRDTFSASICLGERYLFDTTYYSKAGLYTHRYKNQTGCDSLRTLRLQVLAVYRDTLMANICEGKTFRFNNQTLTAPGWYPAKFTSASGCDSTIVLELRLEKVDTTITVTGSSLQAVAQNVKRYAWVDCQTNTPIPGATQRTFLPTRNGRYAVILYTDSCSYQSSCVEFTMTATQEPDISAGFRTYPNPVRDQLIIDPLQDWSGAYELQMLDAQGRLWIRQKIDLNRAQSIDVSGLPDGLYLLHLRHESKGAARWKVVKAGNRE